MEKDIGGSNEKSQTVNLSDVTWNHGKQVLGKDHSGKRCGNCSGYQLIFSHLGLILQVRSEKPLVVIKYA